MNHNYIFNYILDFYKFNDNIIEVVDNSNLIGYNIDFNRVKDTFFSPPKKKSHKKKKNFLKRNKIFLIFSIIFIVGLIFFLSNYEVLIIPYRDVIKSGLSLFNKDILYRIYLLENTNRIKKIKSGIFLQFPLKKQITLSFDLKKPINLEDKNLFLKLKKESYPLKIYVIARDTNFISNASSPILIEFDSKKDYYIPISFKNLKDINLSAINQIRFIFYAFETQSPISKLEKNYVLIKDLILLE